MYIHIYTHKRLTARDHSPVSMAREPSCLDHPATVSDRSTADT